MARCNKDCLNCTLTKCKYDMDTEERRKESSNSYYERNKEAIKQRHRERYAENREERLRKAKENYKSKKQYVRYVEVKKVLNKLKKEIGIVSYNLIWDEIEKLERESLG